MPELAAQVAAPVLVRAVLLDVRTHQERSRERSRLRSGPRGPAATAACGAGGRRSPGKNKRECAGTCAPGSVTINDIGPDTGRNTNSMEGITVSNVSWNICGPLGPTTRGSPTRGTAVMRGTTATPTSGRAPAPSAAAAAAAAPPREATGVPCLDSRCFDQRLDQLVGPASRVRGADAGRVHLQHRSGTLRRGGRRSAHPRAHDVLAGIMGCPRVGKYVIRTRTRTEPDPPSKATHDSVDHSVLWQMDRFDMKLHGTAAWQSSMAAGPHITSSATAGTLGTSTVLASARTTVPPPQWLSATRRSTTKCTAADRQSPSCSSRYAWRERKCVGNTKQSHSDHGRYNRTGQGQVYRVSQNRSH